MKIHGSKFLKVVGDEDGSCRRRGEGFRVWSGVIERRVIGFVVVLSLSTMTSTTEL